MEVERWPSAKALRDRRWLWGIGAGLEDVMQLSLALKMNVDLQWILGEAALVLRELVEAALALEEQRWPWGLGAGFQRVW